MIKQKNNNMLQCINIFELELLIRVSFFKKEHIIIVLVF